MSIPSFRLRARGRNAADVLVEQAREGGDASVVATVQQITSDLRAGKTVSNVDPSLYLSYRPSVQPYLISWFRYDPATEIAKLHLPVLIVQGTTDFQVGRRSMRSA